ncbi:MAG TPA: anaerobic ribonucleoside-triphosphate reductase [Pyrinomonadaceae bacterium]|jgi:ribonucleoside-triphosphate reductase|nr:anaerobic ribonucleoside-triphosphate reductase [Pyrinomonadaceae bacterium]
MTEPTNSSTKSNATEQNARGVDEVLAEIGRAAAALAGELGLDETQSELIGQEVEFAITRSGLRVLTPGLVRELTMAVLAERGVSDAVLRARARIGLSVADAERIIRGENQIAFDGQKRDPLSSDRALSSSIKREYALQAIFSEPVVAAHLAGDIHIEDLGEPDRLFSVTQPYEFPHVRKDGETPLSGREIEHAIGRLSEETRALALHLSGEVVWDAFNWSCAALFGHDSELLTEYAESVVGALASALSGTGCPKVVLHLDWDPPAHLPKFGGDQDEKNLAAPARALMNALLTTGAHAGAGRGDDYSPVRFVVHLRTGWEAHHDYHQTLEAVTRAASAGAPVRLSLDRGDGDDLFVRYGLMAPRRGQTTPPRAFCFGRISINFARLALAYGEKESAEAAEREGAAKLRRCVELAAQAHLEKRIFLEKLLALGGRGPLGRLTAREAGQPYLKLDRAIHLISPVGLGEAIRLTGGGLGEARDTLGHLQSEVERLSAQHKIRLLVAPSRSRQAPLRFARLDNRRQLTKSAPFRAYRADLSIGQHENKGDHFARVEDEAQLHAKSMYEAEVRLNVKGADPKHLAVLISRALYQTHAAALCFHPE